MNTSEKIKEMSNIELIMAFAKCFDNGLTCDMCHGCPLEDEQGCAFYLKLEIAKRLLGGGQNAQ